MKNVQMIDESQKLINEYWRWLRQKTTLRAIGDSVEITTPYLDRHNDYIQIYAQQKDNAIVITDDSHTLDDLELCGCLMNTPKRQEILKTTLNGFGVQLNNNALEVHVSRKDFSVCKHNLLQAILAVDDMFYLSPATVTRVFNEDVKEWLDKSEIRYTPKITLYGKSSYGHVFDFAIPASKREPERLLRAVNVPTKNAIINILFSAEDIKTARPDSRVYALLNDSNKKIPSVARSAMQNYGMQSVPWSDKSGILDQLTA